MARCKTCKKEKMLDWKPLNNIHMHWIQTYVLLYVDGKCWLKILKSIPSLFFFNFFFLRYALKKGCCLNLNFNLKWLIWQQQLIGGRGNFSDCSFSHSFYVNIFRGYNWDIAEIHISSTKSLIFIKWHLKFWVMIISISSMQPTI